MIEGVGKPKRVNRSYQNGFGYIIIPNDEPRDRYIKSCYRQERITIQLDNGGGIIRDCFILQSVLHDIKFPEKPGQLGSCVLFLSDEYHTSPTIIGVVSKREESQSLEENISKKTTASNNGFVNVEKDGNKGDLHVNVYSKFENGGKINVNLNSKNNTAEFNVNCFGKVNIYSEGETVLETLKTTNIQCSYVDAGENKVASRIYLSQDGFLYEDRNGNRIEVSGEEVNIVPKTKLNIFEGSSPMVKGDSLKIQLELMSLKIDGIISTLVAAPTVGNKPLELFGTAMKAGIAALESIIVDFGNINSKKSFLD